MDIYLICENNKDVEDYLTVGKEYKVISMFPKTGLILVKSDTGLVEHVKESRFKVRKDDSMKTCYKPFIIEINVEGKEASGHISYVDENLPTMDSMNEFLNIPSPFGIDLKLTKTGRGTRVFFFDKDGSDKALANNMEALEFAYLIKKTIVLYNILLQNKEYVVKTVYDVQFQPEGKLYTFRSTDSPIIGQLVVCNSCNGKDYGMVVAIKEESEHEYNSRAYCTTSNILSRRAPF